MPNTDKSHSIFTSNRISHFTLVYLVDDPFKCVLGVCDKAGSSRWEGCRVTSVGRGQGLPHARAQPAPADPLQRTAEPWLQCCWEAAEKAAERQEANKKGETQQR